jgi:hypothetical protein
MRLLAALLLMTAPPFAAALELGNTLGEDQLSESVSVSVEGRLLGTLTVDRQHPRARLTLPMTGELLRYRLSGEMTLLDGTRQRISGAGLIESTTGMDRIGEAADADAALAAYQALLRALASAAPEADLDDLQIQHIRQASDTDFSAAEARLGVALADGYKAVIRTHGSLRFGPADHPSGGLYGAGDLKTLQDFVLDEARKNGSDKAAIDAMRAFMDKRFPKTRRDLVIARYEGDSPSVLRAGERCRAGELAYAFPESQWEVLMGSGLDDNAFVGLIDYEDDIVGETQCLSFDKELAYSLHDHLLEMGRDALYVLGPDESVLGFERREPGPDGQIWFRIVKADD